MTRLQTEDIADVSNRLDEYDAELVIKTGCTLRGIACRTAGVDEEKMQTLADSVLVGMVPTTCGKGLIPGFADTVKKIATHIGFETFSTKEPDVAGLAEAFERKSDVIMLADDDRFVAINVLCHHVVDNSVATGRGYVSGLNLMTGGLNGRRVLVIGCGPVGRSSVVALVKLGAKVSIYDVIQQRCHALVLETRRMLNNEISVAKDLNQALLEHKFLIDATPAVNLIGEQAISPKTYISAPGVPHGLSPTVLKKISSRLLHDPLQIGVANMVVEAVCQFLNSGWHDDSGRSFVKV